MAVCKRGKFVYTFGCPMDVYLNRAEDTNVIVFDKLAGVVPGGPVLITIDSACVLECDTKSGRCVVFCEEGHSITPSVIWCRM